MFGLQCVKSQNSSRKFVCWHLMRLFPKDAGKRTSLKRKKADSSPYQSNFHSGDLRALMGVFSYSCLSAASDPSRIIIGAGFKISEAVLRL